MQIAYEAWSLGGLAAASVWLGFILALDQRLKHHHAEVFKALGSPHLIANNTPRHAWLLFRWLYSFSFLGTGDRVIITIASILVVMLPLVLLWIFGPFFIGFPSMAVS